MSNTVSLIPKKPIQHTITTDTQRVLYMPIATKYTHGIVKIGDGLDVSVDGLLSVDFTSGWFGETQTRIDDVINNTIKIGDENNNFATKGATHSGEAGNSISIGNNAKTTGRGDIAVGWKSQTDVGGISIGVNANSFDHAISIGTEAEASPNGVAIGYIAKAYPGSVQLGQGHNKEYGTLQFGNYNIVSVDGKLKTNTGTAVAPEMEVVASEKYVDNKVANLVNSAPETLDTLGEIAKSIQDNKTVVETLESAIVNKADKSELPKKTSELENDSGFITIDDVLGGGSGVSQEDFDKLVNNETQINSNLNSTLKLGGANARGLYSVSIGKNAGTAYSSNGVAIGYESLNRASNGVVVGSFAKTGEFADYSIQLGAGENSTKNTLQVRNDNIYNFNTHTLTVQNIQLNGVDLGTQLGDLNTALETILGV